MQKTDDISPLLLLRTSSVLLLVYVLTAFAVYGETNDLTNWSGKVRITLSAMLVFAACYTVAHVALYRGTTELPRRLLWIEAAAVIALHFTMVEMGLLLTFVAFWIAHTTRVYEPRTCFFLTLGLNLLFLAVFYVRGVADPTEFVVVALLTPAISLFVMSISSTAATLQRQRKQALELNRELQTAQLLLAQSSRTSERLRIAREIHDLLGHQMTALILNLQVATHKTAGDGLTHVERSLALAKMLLSDLRNAVSDMRENPALDFDSALTELLANVPELKVTLERQPDIAVHDPRVAEALLRCIQEALTNILRHARAKTCHIRLYRDDSQLVLDIQDDGTSPTRVKPGNGLKGMQERMAALAGSLHWHNDKGSFRLRARLPFAETGA